MKSLRSDRPHLILPALAGVCCDAENPSEICLAGFRDRCRRLCGADPGAGKPDAALTANKRLGDLYAGIASNQLALGYYAKALELPVRGPEDEQLKTAARTARDALIRKLSAAK